MCRRRRIYSAQNVIDHFDGNFDIPCDGVESDIEGFKEDDTDVDETVSEAGDDEIILPRYFARLRASKFITKLNE